MRTMLNYHLVIIVPDGTSYASNESILDVAIELKSPIISQKFFIKFLEEEVANSDECFFPDSAKDSVDDAQFIECSVNYIQKNGCQKILLIAPPDKAPHYKEILNAELGQKCEISDHVVQ